MAYKINYRYSDGVNSYWTGPTGQPFDDEAAAYIAADKESNASKESFRKCIDAGLDVPFISDYKVVEV